MDVLSSRIVSRSHHHEYRRMKKLQVNAVTDPLTGLYNRRIFAEILRKGMNRARRYNLPLGLVILACIA